MELFRALAVLAEPPGSATVRIARLLELGGTPTPEAYTELFLLQLYPYASVYLGADGMLGGEARDRIAGFWRVLGHTPPAEPDHLATLLALYATLGEHAAAQPAGERRAALQRSRATLFWEHLASWVPPFAAKLEGLGPEPYAAWARTLLDALASEAARLPAPPRAPLHFREAPAFPAAPVGSAPWLGALLAPAVSGLILTRTDCARAARELGLALRAGERRFVLRALVEQDAPALIAWLGREAAAWAARHDQLAGSFGIAARHWSARARATADALAALSYVT